MRRQIMGLAFAAALLGASQAQAMLLIDSFDATQPTSGVLAAHSPGTYTTPDVTGVGIVGGTRQMELEITGATGSSKNMSTVFVDSGLLSLSNDTGQSGFVTLTYDTLGGVDVTNGGLSTEEFLVFRVTAIDHDINVTVCLTDTAAAGGDTGCNTYLKRELEQPAGNGDPQIVGPIFGIPGNYYHTLDLFVNGATVKDPATGLFFGGNTSLDLASIDKITVKFDTGGGELDVDVDCLYTGGRQSTGFDANGLPTFDQAADGVSPGKCTVIPEPTSLLLLGTGLVGLGLAGVRARTVRRRQRA